MRRRAGGSAVAVAVAVAAWCQPASAAGSTARSAAGSRVGPAPCAAAPAAGGEWPIYGHDLANTRSQPDAHGIGPSAVSGLKAAWVFKTSAFGDPSAFNTTPVIDGGCAFIGSGLGGIYAVDVASGKLVWKRAVNVPKPGLGGAIVGAAAVHGNEVIELVNASGGPYAVALDRSTGSLLWRSPPVSTAPGIYTNASPIVARGLVVFGFSPKEGTADGQGGFALLDAGTGRIVKVTPTITPADQARGFAGGGLWSTPAFDRATGFLYWGAGNPDSKTKQDPHTDAILKIDLRRSSPTFGAIVASYAGNVDQYSSLLQSLSQTPVCALSAQPSLPYPFDDPLCGQLDLDFGAAAQLLTDRAGGKLVGDLQKSGVYHAVHADTMAPAWTRAIGISCQFCNAASTAVDPRGVYGVGTPGGVMYRLSRDTGAVKWQSPILDIVHYQSTSVADGVVYTLDGAGFLDAFDAASGATLLKRQTALDVGTFAGFNVSSDGLAIGEGTVLAALSSASGFATSDLSSEANTTLPAGEGAFLVAYRVPG